MKPLKPLKLDTNPKTRDLLMVRLINGATKAGAEKDRRKEASRLESRKWKWKGERE